MNQAWEKIIRLMSEYDRAAVGSPEKAELGKRLDKEGARLSERDLWKIAIAYEKAKAEKDAASVKPA